MDGVRFFGKNKYIYIYIYIDMCSCTTECMTRIVPRLVLEIVGLRGRRQRPSLLDPTVGRPEQVS